MASRTRENPLDSIRQEIVEALSEWRDEQRSTAKGVRPFDNVELSVEEEAMLYDNPSLRYPGEVSPETGLPLSNAEAAERWYQEITHGDQYPSRFVEMVENVERRRSRRERTQQDGGEPMPSMDTAAPAY